MSSDALENFLEEHRCIRQALPSSWNPFFARFGSLRPVQIAAIPPVLAGNNVLITAPTAGGKTEAIAAPICERMIRERWTGLSVLLVTPTRALVNDLFFRLQVPCAEMNVFLGRKTADHAISTTEAEQFLITTPESLESLMTFRRERLAHLRAIIIDEIHLLDGSPRGDQLRLLLNRLHAYLQHIHPEAGCRLQRCALSATVSNPQRVAEVYLGSNAQIVSVAGQRAIEARIVIADGDDQTRAASAVSAASEFDDVHKVLVFVNSRKQVDASAGFFQCGAFSKHSIYGHHGNLGKKEREKTEACFKNDTRAICVATMTLEVGIDIGDVDLVICIDPPFSLSSFLQRIGRGCRRRQGQTRVVCLGRDRASQLIFESFISQAKLGMPEGPVAPFRRSVLVQQVLAYLRQVDAYRRTDSQFRNVFASPAGPSIRDDVLAELLNDMVTSKLLTHRNGVYEPAGEGWGFIESSRVYSNIAPTLDTVALVDADSGTTIAYVKNIDEGAAGLRIAGKSFDLLPGGNRSKRSVRLQGDHLGSPTYHARKLPYAFDVGASIRSKFGIPPNELLVIQCDDSIMVMTWLGRLLNLAIAQPLKNRRLLVASSAFALFLRNVGVNEIVTTLRDAVASLHARNPFGELEVERAADLGPHLELLSDSEKEMARADWLDLAFLDQWVAGLSVITPVAANTNMAEDMFVLAAK